MPSPSSTKAPPRAAFFFAFAAIYLIWGSTYLAIRVAVSTLPPFLLAGARFLLAGALLLAWIAATRGFHATRRQWRDNAIIGALLLLAGNGLVVWAEQAIPSGVTTLIIAINPLLFAVGEWVLPRGQRPTTATFAGIGLGLIGLVLLVGPGGAAGDVRHAAGVLVACASWTAGSLYSRRVRDPSDPLTGACLQMLCASVLLLAVARARGELSHLAWSAVTGASLLAWGYLVLAGSLVAYSCYVWLLKHSTATRVSTFAYVNPVVAVFLGWSVLHEPLTPRLLAASVVIIGGVLIITWHKSRVIRA
jgi:drug/metabolite transporter (DMT)-like permease